jgi:alpha-L-arabinofuranosidase
MAPFRYLLPTLLALAAAFSQAHADTLTISADKPGAKIDPMLYGLMTEEINYSYQGGLYAELVQNRDFKDDSGPTTNHWTMSLGNGAAGTMTLDPDQPVNTVALTTSLKLDATTATKTARVGISNDGYWGIPVKPNTTYHASFYARSAGAFSGPVTVSIESADGTTTFATADVSGLGDGWKHFTTTLNTGNVPPSSDNRFVVSLTQPGTVWLSLVSLFPPTYHDRPNGTRIDLMQKLAAMHPAFLRFPGGNYLEGDTIAQRFDWKKTIGDISLRPGHRSPWNYHSTDGFGLLEFLEWCEDLNMAPILAVYGGYSLHGEHVTGAQLQPFVQDALDEIEYVTGDATTTWGARRAADGHPAAFDLKYVEINNEDFFDHSGSYDGRFKQFHDAIKAKYPNLQLIATARVRSVTPDLVDEHFYNPWPWMIRNTTHYDNASRNGPKIFVGEWASQDIPARGPTPSFASALGDAAWMIGLERNADLITIQCYAPLLVNVNPRGRQWSINLIGYNNLNSFGSPSYYAQAMFAGNRGDAVLPTALTQGGPAATPPPARGSIGVGSWNTQAEYKDIQVTAGTKVLYQSNFISGTDGWTFPRGDWSVVDGALRQSDNAQNDLATIGSADWTDYTLHLQARKVSGAEGFLIRFHQKNDGNYIHLNLGGWGNRQHGLEQATDGAKSDLGRRVAGNIEDGRWYDIRIEVQGTDIRCYLDNEMIIEAQDIPIPTQSLITTASRDTATGDVILKAVNPTANAEKCDITVAGVPPIAGATGQELTGALDDFNTLDTPEKVAPRDFTLDKSALNHEFPPHSITLLRLKTQ